ncbi:Uncharacterized protein ChrSV_3487 [Chromobacterium vaccinii]|nr:Uncharacterized protein ChrSW_3487 [Chromobacterium vaccinii]QND90944.1 Uncharacterized protein ChrSV_3487 [Chromobacterium vaccinii]
MANSSASKCLGGGKCFLWQNCSSRSALLGVFLPKSCVKVCILINYYVNNALPAACLFDCWLAFYANWKLSGAAGMAGIFPTRAWVAGMGTIMCLQGDDGDGSLSHRTWRSG